VGAPRHNGSDAIRLGSRGTPTKGHDDDTPRRTPSSAELATEGNGLLAGLGILTVALFPIALPGLLLFVVAPLLLVAMVGLVLLPLWLARTLVRSRSRRRCRAPTALGESGYRRVLTRLACSAGPVNGKAAVVVRYLIYTQFVYIAYPATQIWYRNTGISR
jgi:uncharacterized membrane protein YedE/YeeE